MGRVKRSIELAKSSWGVIRSQPQLTILPVVSFVATVVVFASFAVPVILLIGSTDTSGSVSPVAWVLVALGYLATTYAVVFFNTALVWAANEHFEGRRPSLGSALGAAVHRAGRILPWAVVSTTVSLALRAGQDRFGFIGQIAVGLAGVAWGLVTFLVLPVIVLEGLGTRAAVKRSATMFKHTWGENALATGGIGLLGVVAVLCATPLLALLFTGSTPLMVLGAALFAIWLAVVAVTVSSMSVVFQTALYRYAAGDGAPAAYAEVDLAHTFTPEAGPRAVTA